MTDARAGKVGVKVLSELPTPFARAGKVAEKVLIDFSPDARTGKVAIKVLLRKPHIYWWDGVELQAINTTVSGWWDGSAIQPISWPGGWWDGDSIEPTT